jgi:alkyl sulfatase BDS1-like metallo-beta-lactamase superfamily hydrolase
MIRRTSRPATRRETAMGDDGALKDATQSTSAHIILGMLQELPLGDARDFADAARGCIGTPPEVTFARSDGRIVSSLGDYAFRSLKEAPDTVNPSPWRQARRNLHNGLRGRPTHLSGARLKHLRHDDHRG